MNRKNSERVLLIRSRLMSAFSPSELEVIDESHLHAGHVGAQDGRGHFRVNIVSSMFAGRTHLQRHRMIFTVLGNLMQTDIHALSISALGEPPAEIQ